ncbi:hypothetical protein GTV32_15780 [Gordonia sp. SID5947]|uniref:hypothetical protein n=1 Tax=Gordonia sp. SID5947 TaxID=2690315 RepID=UPI00136C250C|nr:hypothetical protein [Gordonia sp. SID5947]MYR07675.1 hypothetical protein [Gordonia sp. SID5947]
MIPPGADDHPDNTVSRYPQPPYPADLLADLHADALPTDVAEYMRSRLADDPDARAILAALDRTTAQLRGATVPPVPVPAEVASRTRQTLDALAAESSSSDGGTVGELATRRRRRTRARWLAAGAVAAALVAVFAVIGVLRSPEPDRPVQAQPSSSTFPGLGPGDRVAMLSVLGKKDFAPFGSEEALRRCTGANGVPSDTVVLGTGRATIRGLASVVILLSTGTAGRFDALVVAPDCTTGNPARISRTTIGG